MNERQTNATPVRAELRRTGSAVIAATLVLGGLGVCGCSDAPDPNQPKDVMDVLHSLKAELGKLSSAYPELAGAGDINVISAPDGSEHTVAYRNNCTFTGKRGYEDTGANACAVALRVMTGKQYQKDVNEIAMQIPDFRWENLQLVGWANVYVGKKPSAGFEDAMNQLLGEHVLLINALDARAAAK